MVSPRVSRWISTPLLMLALAACQKTPEATPPPEAAPKQTAPEKAVSKAVSAEPTSFDAIARHLDAGGGFYLFLSTESFLKTASDKLAQVRSLILENTPAESQAQATKGWDYLSRFASQSGVDEISGFGASTIAIEPGYYQTKWMLHHYEGKGNGLLWKLNGGASDALEIIPWLPEHTALASSGDFSLVPIWDFLNQEAATKPELRQGIDQLAQQLEAGSGLKLANLIASLGPRYSIVITLDESRPTTLPSGAAENAFTFPEPAFALLIQVRDPALLARVEEDLAKIPGVVAADEGDLKLRNIPAPLPFPFVRPAVAWQNDTLILSSNEALIREMVAVKAGKKPGIAATSADFKKVTADLPSPASQFKVVAPIFQKTILDFQLAIAKQQPNTPPETERFLQFFASSMPEAWSSGVVRNTPEGFVGFSRGAAGPAQIATIGALAPVAIVAGMTLPAFTAVKEKGTQTKSLSNAKQIFLACKLYAGDHEGNFPATLDELVPSYLRNASVLADPIAPEAGNIGYHYFGGKETDAPDKVLLVSKGVGKNGMRVVLTCDGSGRVRSATEEGL